MLRGAVTTDADARNAIQANKWFSDEFTEIDESQFKCLTLSSIKKVGSQCQVLSKYFTAVDSLVETEQFEGEHPIALTRYWRRLTLAKAVDRLHYSLYVAMN